LRLLRPALGRSVFGRENTSLRDAARELAGLRDRHVLVRTFDALIASSEGAIAPQTVAVVRGTLAEREQTDGGTLDRHLVGTLIETLRRFRERTALWPLRDAGWDVFEGGLEWVYRCGRTAFAEAYDEPSTQRFHEWRKRVKDLWHQLEWFERLWPEVLGQQASETHALSDDLGDDHDLGVLRETLKGFGPLVGPAEIGNLVVLIDRRRAELQQRAHLRGEKIYAEKPKAFLRRMENYFLASVPPEVPALPVRLSLAPDS
jgi:CHAD domain-containing protein